MLRHAPLLQLLSQRRLQVHQAAVLAKLAVLVHNLSVRRQLDGMM